jgi:4-alpha-glucanotransferase
MPLPTRAAGVLLHLTSLPGPHGVGDLGADAHRFVDWLHEAGQTLWQWLPTSPVGPGNSPYQSVSAFAGSPLMVALEPLVARGWLAPPQLPAGGFDAGRVDFGRVTAWRMARLREAAEGFARGAAAADRRAFEDWCAAQAWWLDDYVLFMAIETAEAGRPWWQWPAPLARRDARALAEAGRVHAREIAFWRFVQWCFDEQCTALKAHANRRGIAIVGDLPIFIAHHSADCWARPDLFELDEDFGLPVLAGVPPDSLGPFGQRWGNPLYRWDRMAAEGYRWWTDRVRRSLHQMDVFRIDHFRGFAGYWEIPADSPTAQRGRWRRGPGRALFDAIARELGELPVIAEDLGFITPDVHELRERCGFPGMKILQFAFGGDGAHEFLPHNYERDVVVYTGTHDNDTARGWWHAASDRERHYAGTYLACGEADIHWALIRAACNSVARMALYPLQDVMGLPAQARMNLPGTMGDANWTWRFDWPKLHPEHARVLGFIAAASGRAPLERMGLPAIANDGLSAHDLALYRQIDD